MNPTFITLLRYLLTFGGGYLVSKGTLDAVTLEQLIGAVITIVTTGFGLYVNTKNNEKVKAANMLLDQSSVPHVPYSAIDAASDKVKS